MTTEQFIIKKLSDGFLQPEISKRMKALGMKPNSGFVDAGDTQTYKVYCISQNSSLYLRYG